MGRTTMRALGLLAAVAAGCASASLRESRARLQAGDLAGAARTAVGDRRALSEVAFAVLEAGLAEPETRRAAAAALADLGRGARPELARLAAEGDEATSCAAASVLLRLGDRAVVPRLEACLEATDPGARAAALALLGADPARGLGLLRAGLSDPEPGVRAEAARGLGHRGGAPGAPELLASAARDAEARVRAAALGGLGRRSDPELAVATARAALGDEALGVRLAAVELLGRLADRAEARAALSAFAARREGPEAIRAAAHLARSGEAEGGELLARALASGSAEDAATAAVAAGQLGPSMAEALRAALGRPESSVRFHAAVALRAAGESSAAAAELAMLVGEPGWTGLLAAVELWRARPATARDRLAQALEQAEAPERAYAVAAAAAHDDGLELAALGLGDLAPTVRVAAAASVLRILRRQG